MNLISNLARSWAQYRTFRATLAELQMCSDRQLEDMGFARGDLVRVAYEAAELGAAAGDRRRPAPRAHGLRAPVPAAG
jgi:uncharacterized protein YjiS (DUF1127 family)